MTVQELMVEFQKLPPHDEVHLEYWLDHIDQLETDQIKRIYQDGSLGIFISSIPKEWTS
jgi:hypothetical protein